MDAKAELNKMWKDLHESAREFAALGLTAGTKVLEVAGVKLKSLEETLKKTAEHLGKTDKPAAEPTVATAAPAAETTPAVDTSKQ